MICVKYEFIFISDVADCSIYKHSPTCFTRLECRFNPVPSVPRNLVHFPSDKQQCGGGGGESILGSTVTALVVVVRHFL